MTQLEKEIGYQVLMAYCQALSGIDLPHYQRHLKKVYMPRVLAELMIRYEKHNEPRCKRYRFEGDKIFNQKIEIVDGYELAVVAVMKDINTAWWPEFVSRVAIKVAHSDILTIYSSWPRN